MGFFDKLKQGLTKTKESINGKINDVFSNFRRAKRSINYVRHRKRNINEKNIKVKRKNKERKNRR